MPRPSGTGDGGGAPRGVCTRRGRLTEVRAIRRNADLGRRALIDTRAEPWIASPESGVERRMLDRDGGEVARATSLVRYAPGSRFPRHVHARGEEFLVLEGSFADEHGEYPAGTYVRNPPGSAHAPCSEQGCILFVKLRQFAADDLERVVIDTGRGAWRGGGPQGLAVLPLHEHGREQVALVRWPAGARFAQHAHPLGEEVLVLEGSFADEHGTYGSGTWLRSPPGSEHAPWSDAGCLLYLKRGHLAG